MIEALRHRMATRGTALLLGGGMLAGCGGLNGYPVPERDCAAISVEGRTLSRSSYPLGQVAVRFSEQPNQFSARIDMTETRGVIRKTEDGYRLEFTDELPTEFARDGLDPALADHGAALQITMPDSSVVGVTTGCIQDSERGDFGVTMSVVELPTAS